MIDLVAVLSARGHYGSVRAISRRGLLPQMHEPAGRWTSCLRAGRNPARIASYVRCVRAAIEAADGDWRGVIDALRADTQELWRQLPEVERRRFMRHVRPWWDVHRHRKAPQVAALMGQLRADGAFCFEA